MNHKPAFRQNWTFFQTLSTWLRQKRGKNSFDQQGKKENKPEWVHRGDRLRLPDIPQWVSIEIWARLPSERPACGNGCVHVDRCVSAILYRPTKCITDARDDEAVERCSELHRFVGNAFAFDINHSLLLSTQTAADVPPRCGIYPAHACGRSSGWKKNIMPDKGSFMRRK